MPGFLKTLKKWLADSYDYLGLVITSSLIWFGVALVGLGAIIRAVRPNVLLGLAEAAGYYVLVIAPLTAGVFYLARKIVTRDDPSLSDVLRGTRELLLPAWTLGLAQAVITTAILVNIWFYLTHGGLAPNVLGVFFVYLMLLWMLSSVYHYPLLVEQRPGALKIIKRGFLLAVDNIAFTAGTFFAIILLTCLCVATFFGLPLLSAGMAGVLLTRALRALFVKYELLEPEKEYVAGEDTVLKPILTDQRSRDESEPD